ncbi:hypothetical protein CC80DRAFT_477970 [Byssothecium circinans]|uniref:BTB domain-containing protein n=1 Tax=Byssothecium circinans TaxID=147558 RepID=A0A6A5TL56_9PLEO|nr:hypothetical protein CC80DRAFT_477970 [Byssothecium circinans]
MTVCHEKILGSVKASYKSGDYFDLTIVCGPDEHKVHKILVCPRVEFFTKAVDFGGKASTPQPNLDETEKNMIELPHDEPAIIKLLIQFLYEGEYDPVVTLNSPPSKNFREALTKHLTQLKLMDKNQEYSFAMPHTCALINPTSLQSCDSKSVCPHHTCKTCKKNCHSNCKNFMCGTCMFVEPTEIPDTVDGPPEQLLIHAKMYEIGDKYGVDGLKGLAQKKFKIVCEKHWDDDVFAKAAHHAFSTTVEEDQGLREVVRDTICKNVGLIKKPEVGDLMDEFNLTLVIFRMKMERQGELMAPEYSDLVIECGIDVHKVHRFVVCTQSSFFKAAVRFPGEESNTGIIKLPEDDPAIIKLLIQYLYECDYPPKVHQPEHFELTKDVDTYSMDYGSFRLTFPHSCSSPDVSCDQMGLCPHHICGQACRFTCKRFICALCTLPKACGPEHQLITHAKMYELGDKYEVCGLKDLAKLKFARACVAFWNTPSFPHAASYAYSSTVDADMGLRDIVRCTISAHMSMFHDPEIKELLSCFGDLAHAILAEKFDGNGWEKDQGHGTDSRIIAPILKGRKSALECESMICVASDNTLTFF